MKRTALLILGLGMLSVMQSAYSLYNANMVGVVTEVLTYTNNDQILFRLDNQPSSHPLCLTDFFVIDPTIPTDRRNRILSRLLLAYALGKPVNVGYDKDGDCAQGRIRVHRVG